MHFGMMVDKVYLKGGFPESALSSVSNRKKTKILKHEK